MSQATDTPGPYQFSENVQKTLMVTETGSNTGSDDPLYTIIKAFDSDIFGPLALDASPTVNLATDHYDEMTRAVTTIEYEHHEIHGGSHYFVASYFTLGSEDTAIFSVTTPAGSKLLHMSFAAQGTSQTEFTIHEDSVVASGTPVVPFNNNRNSDNTTVATILRDPEVTTAGSLIWSQSVGLAGDTPSRADNVGVISRRQEIVLKADSTYVFTITSADADNIISQVAEWYEHTNRSNS